MKRIRDAWPLAAFLLVIALEAIANRIGGLP